MEIKNRCVRANRGDAIALNDDVLIVEEFVIFMPL
jgi:hypothetical protein